MSFYHQNDHHGCQEHGHDFHEECHECRKHRHHHDDCDCMKHHHHRHDHDCDCKKHHHHRHDHDCDCKNIATCKHPIIFDRRFLVDERMFHHHDHFRFDDCHDHHFDFHHDHDCCCHNHFICNDRFRFRLAGLQGGMAFRFRQLIGCKVKIEADCESTGTEKLHAKMIHVGSDFIEVEVIKKEKKKKKPALARRKPRKKKDECKKHEFRMIPFESLSSISVMEDDCC